MKESDNPEAEPLGRHFRRSFASKKVLVTGGAGFLGSWLCDTLVASGADVVCLDDLSTGKVENVRGLQAAGKVITGRVESVEVPGDFDYLFHFASSASPEEYQTRPIQTLSANSEGTARMLRLASEKDAVFVYASTSEVYGDAAVVPTPETYWGNVNPIGVRSCYDEGKRFGEALCMAYFRQKRTRVRMARIFNSIPATEKVLFLNDSRIHNEPVGKAESRISARLSKGNEIWVPAFNPTDCSARSYRISALEKHYYDGDIYSIETTYGRKVRVTGDHSVFIRGPNGKPMPMFARCLRKGDHVAVPRRIEIPEDEFNAFKIIDLLALSGEEQWKVRVTSPEFSELITQKRSEIVSFMRRSGHFKRNCRIQALISATGRYTNSGSLPLPIIGELQQSVPPGAAVSRYCPGKHHLVPNQVLVDEDFLWLIGLYLAEGFGTFNEDKGTYQIGFSSDEYNLVKASKILGTKFNVHVVRQPASPGRPPALLVNSWILWRVFQALGLHEKRIPSWIFHLPRQRLGFLLEGFKDGDGTHSGKSVGKLLGFSSSRRGMAEDLSMVLMRFGIVATVRRYTTTFRKKYGDKRFPFYRVSIRGLNNYDILTWHKGVQQTLNSATTKDIVWAYVKRVKRGHYSGMAYDFSVPGAENFTAGFGVYCHNTYGPRIRSDGIYARALPRFLDQATSNKPITIYGDGKQTRSFTYVTDTIGGILKFASTEGLDGEAFNIGNPEEITILQLGKTIIRKTKSKSKLKFMDAAEDDPRRRCPDISKASRLLGYSPKVTLEEGLGRLIPQWQQGNIPPERL